VTAFLHRVRASSLAQNTAALYGIHFTTLLLPLVTIPYLARILRPEGWGLVVFCQSFAAWLSLVLEYGFSLSATRMVAKVRTDRGRVAAVVSGVVGARGLLLMVLTSVASVTYLAIPAFRAHPTYLFWAWLLAVAQGLSPFWYFQGMERMRLFAMIEVVCKVAATIGVFLLVRQPLDGWIVLALGSGAALTSVAAGTVLIYREVRWLAPRWATTIEVVRHGWPLFAFRGASGLYMQATPFMVGLFAGPAAAAFFGGAEKIVRAGVGLIQPISQAIYPRVSHLMTSNREAAAQLLRITLPVIAGMGLLLGASVELSAATLVHLLLGPGYESAVPVLRILSILPPVIAVATVLGIQWALPMGHDRKLLAYVVGAGTLNVVGALLLVPRFGAAGMAFAVGLAETSVALNLLWLAWRNAAEFWPWRREEKLAAAD
jgi:polysaccharide transporter, PST family